MSVNADVALLLRRRGGRFAVSDAGFATHGEYTMVEVDEHGNVHQLTPEGRRYGVLSREGWDWKAQVYAVGPDRKVFVRLSTGAIVKGWKS